LWCRESSSANRKSHWKVSTPLRPLPFKLVYVDGNSPPSLRRYLECQASALGFQLIRTDSYLTSNEAHNLGLREVCTEYVAFLDNEKRLALQLFIMASS
jgi:hypothetical protein